MSSKAKTKTTAKTKPKPVAPGGKISGDKAPLRCIFPPGVLLGAHTSTSGGVSQAIGRAQACGFTTAQIFVKNNKQWFAPSKMLF
jgi:hypothetical protein